ncbi:hypothetical protein AD05_4728 [Escherichia coli 5-366-08_S4_C2]|nr:hypothetical protein ECBCE019MS13_3277 [Escherichia coli BCE019_MS-13]EMX27060.1 hypothetical protein ECMP0215661_0154 [Escherichia coli MP021566.1]ENA26907.1 hypothetical protein ECBCE007MS11_4756 [Escherichia coli BCE007_MS-11]ENA76618.1 hypothetical protein EC2730450_3322 [Escherichia coli 2730450]ENA80723.1 hypothetical protein EC2741950_2270 [Escherichia coli 2741950]ENB28791.1 hypothetical protein ECBCE032MS12_4890 [Escherichia coli BCE032_MS-12]END50835.1 hypothetical protein ECBCE0
MIHLYLHHRFTFAPFMTVIRNAEGQLRWRCWNFESNAGKQLNVWLASEGLLRQ